MDRLNPFILRNFPVLKGEKEEEEAAFFNSKNSKVDIVQSFFYFILFSKKKWQWWKLTKPSIYTEVAKKNWDHIHDSSFSS